MTNLFFRPVRKACACISFCLLAFFVPIVVDGKKPSGRNEIVDHSSNLHTVYAGIDSVRIRIIQQSCFTFQLESLVYPLGTSINSWSWSFGDGATSASMRPTHTYSNRGMFKIKLIVANATGARDSITLDVKVPQLDFDFEYSIDVCAPLSVSFKGVGNDIHSPYWEFGDGNSIRDESSASHLFPAPGIYSVRYAAGNGTCSDTIEKRLTVGATWQDIVLTSDTIICAGTPKQLRTKPSLGFCWSPANALDSSSGPNPVARASATTTYYFTAAIEGTNLLKNGSFSFGNTGFTSFYMHAPSSGLPEGTYTVTSDVRAWHPLLATCAARGGSGNMLLVNGAAGLNTEIWKHTVTVQPHTNYAFSTWLQSLSPNSPAELQFSINGNLVGSLLRAPDVTCEWSQFYTTWNSGGNTSATISIVNRNLVELGNDFAIDDISFAPVLLRWDSVNVTVRNLPVVVASRSNDVDCITGTSQLSAVGAVKYAWSPASLVDKPDKPTAVASPLSTTKYMVTGTDAAGCRNTDSVLVKVEKTNKGSYQLPSAFSPNGDGVNDCYRIQFWGPIEDFEFSVFNRWGDRVFFTRDPFACWDGTFRGKPLASDVFVYLIRARTGCEDAVLRKGTITLMK